MGSAKDGLRALGQLIRHRRVAAGLTQDQLGKRAGIVGKYVSEIERGTRDVPFSTLHGIVEDGLALRLDVRFGTAAENGRATKVIAPLPRPVELIARAIAELPAERRTLVLVLVRTALRIIG
ncbi:MAG: helix-turn-helix transcriptional regulator [Kofleriaceae bacterium]